MPNVTLYLRGDQIATYGSAGAQGNGTGLVLTLGNVRPLGTASDIYRVVVTQVNAGATEFRNGQFVAIYTWSEANPQGSLVYSGLNPQDDMYQGRASGAGYQVFASPARVLIDVNGITAGTVIYSNATGEPLSNRLPFDALAATPGELVICFAAGTRILTPRGLRAVESLVPGDPVWTRGRGMQPLAWVGRRSVCGLGHLAPIRIAPGTFGNDRAVRVSPQHRILVSGWQAELHFGEAEVLVAARHLVDGARIRPAPVARIDYVHVAFDRHEIICAEGMLSESLLPGAMALAALPRAARDEVMAIFPELAAPRAAWPATRPARPCLSRQEAGVLRLPPV